MSRGLAIIIAGAVLLAPGLTGWFPGMWGQIAGWIGVALTITGGLIQEYDSKPFEFKFAKNDWEAVPSGFQIQIRINKHKKGNAAAGEIYSLDTSGFYSTCMCDVGSDSDGNILVQIDGPPFAGRLVIR